jgi:hypothetical protein
VKAALISTNYHDETGCVTVNVVDAMMQIAMAINRLAASHEAMIVRGEKLHMQLKQAMQPRDGEDEPGHA